jgi:signal peptidase I
VNIDDLRDDEEEIKPEKPKNGIKEFLDSLVIAFVIAIVILTFLLGNYMIPSGSMLETLQQGDRILVNKLAYVFGEPEHGDVAVFEYPLQPELTFIKRVIGVPGDTIRITNRKIIRNGDILEEPYVATHLFRPFVIDPVDNVPTFVVPQGMYLMMGDNRDGSDDGRYWGLIPASSFKGKAMIVYFSKEPGGSVRFGRFFTLIK